MDFQLEQLNERAIMIDFGSDINEITFNKIKTVTAFLDQNPFPWLIEYVPAFTTVTIFYDPIKILPISSTIRQPSDYVIHTINHAIRGLIINRENEARIISIPVCYGGEFGPDLGFVAEYHHLTTEEIIKIHSSTEYTVYMLGFAPGFPYLGGLSETIHTPRKDTPSLKIPAGSVGIAGKQTGIYSIETPGGWQIIGRTPLSLFHPNESNPSLLQAGDRIRFSPISDTEFAQWEEQYND